MKIKNWPLILGVLLLSVYLSGCIFSSESQQARETAEAFWQAVLDEDMDKAKDLVTWESTQYLQFLHNKSLAAQRFETGEIRVEETTAEVATLLYGGEKGDMPIPLRTVMIRGKDEWQVDVQKTMGSMVSGAMGAVADQLSDFMEEGLKGLDQALTESVNELNQSLQQGVEELRKDLTPQPETPEFEQENLQPKGTQSI